MPGTPPMRRYNPKLRVDVEKAKWVRQFFRWDDPGWRASQGRYSFVLASTLERWAEASGRGMLWFVDAEWYWRTYGYPEHVAKVFAWENRMSCREAMFFLRRVRRFFVAAAQDYGVDMRRFCNALAGVLPDPAEQAKRDARAILEGLLAVRSPLLVRNLLQKAWERGPEVLLGEAQADGAGEAV